MQQFVQVGVSMETASGLDIVTVMMVGKEAPAKLVIETTSFLTN